MRCTYHAQLDQYEILRIQSHFQPLKGHCRVHTARPHPPHTLTEGEKLRPLEEGSDKLSSDLALARGSAEEGRAGGG